MTSGRLYKTEFSRSLNFDTPPATRTAVISRQRIILPAEITSMLFVQGMQHRSIPNRTVNGIFCGSSPQQATRAGLPNSINRCASRLESWGSRRFSVCTYGAIALGCFRLYDEKPASGSPSPSPGRTTESVRVLWLKIHRVNPQVRKSRAHRLPARGKSLDYVWPPTSTACFFQIDRNITYGQSRLQTRFASPITPPINE